MIQLVGIIFDRVIHLADCVGSYLLESSGIKDGNRLSHMIAANLGKAATDIGLGRRYTVNDGRIAVAVAKEVAFHFAGLSG